MDKLRGLQRPEFDKTIKDKQLVNIVAPMAACYIACTAYPHCPVQL